MWKTRNAEVLASRVNRLSDELMAIPCRWNIRPPRPSNAQVHASESLVFPQFAGDITGNDFAGGDKVIPVRDFHGFPEILFHQQHGHTERPGLADRLEQGCDDSRR